MGKICSTDRQRPPYCHTAPGLQEVGKIPIIAQLENKKSLHCSECLETICKRQERCSPWVIQDLTQEKAALEPRDSAQPCDPLPPLQKVTIINEHIYQTHPKLLQIIQEQTGGKNPPFEHNFAENVLLSTGGERLICC